jgi:hypothetical protein
MEQHMLKIDREIEDDDRRRNFQPRPQRGPVEQAPPLGLGDKRHANGGGREKHPYRECVDYDDADIARPSLPPADRLRSPGGQQLPHGHDGKDTGERRQADQGFGRQGAPLEKRLTHPSSFINSSIELWLR